MGHCRLQEHPRAVVGRDVQWRQRGGCQHLFCWRGKQRRVVLFQVTRGSHLCVMLPQCVGGGGGSRGFGRGTQITASRGPTATPVSLLAVICVAHLLVRVETHDDDVLLLVIRGQRDCGARVHMTRCGSTLAFLAMGPARILDLYIVAHRGSITSEGQLVMVQHQAGNGATDGVGSDDARQGAEPEQGEDKVKQGQHGGERVVPST
mmetsp:Transcript_10803/g.34382  ORF Transcript_10803/g.34382 Transcript_10803/m.34382 type:complete len:206 (+) Transcript_10803:665-1282(+)